MTKEKVRIAGKCERGLNKRRGDEEFSLGSRERKCDWNLHQGKPGN